MSGKVVRDGDRVYRVKTGERAAAEIRNTLLLMDWIDAQKRDPEDTNNWTDKSVHAAREWARRTKWALTL